MFSSVKSPELELKKLWDYQFKYNPKIIIQCYEECNNQVMNWGEL